MPEASPNTLDVPDSHLADLQGVLENEIPICAQMGIRVVGYDGGRLAVTMPLALNRNHQQTAFAGSLNALCTIAGWGTLYLLLRRLGLEGNIVIRRSSIRYHRPAVALDIVARCLPVETIATDHFAEMLQDKGQAKLDLLVEIVGDDGAAVSFSGSYVVMANDE